MQGRALPAAAPENRQVFFDYPDTGRAQQEEPEEEEDNIQGPCDAFTHAFSGNRVFGMGFCGRLCDNDLDPSKKNQYDDLLKSVKQHRSYFTYWYTFCSRL